MYEAAYAELDREQVADRDAVCRALRDRRLDQSVLYSDFTDAHRTHVRSTESVSGMCLVSDGGRWPATPAAMMKTAVLSEIQMVLTGQVHEDAAGELGYLPGGFEPERQNLDVWSALVHFRPLVERGLGFILPTQCVLSECNKLASGTHRRKLPERGASLAFDVLGSLPYFSDPATDAPDRSVLRIMPRLPGVEGLSLDAILSLREEEAPRFQAFQMRLVERLSALDRLDDERELLRVLLEIDHEVRGIEERFRLLQRRRLLSATRAVTGMAGIGICTVVDAELAKALGSLLGTFGVRDLLQSIEAEIIERKKLREEPYFFPWLVHDRSSRCRRHQ